MKKCEEEFFKKYSVENLKEVDKLLSAELKGKNTKQFNEIRYEGLKQTAAMVYRFKIRPTLKQCVQFKSQKNLVILRLRAIHTNAKAGQCQEQRGITTKSIVDQMIEVVEEVMA